MTTKELERAKEVLGVLLHPYLNLEDLHIDPTVVELQAVFTTTLACMTEFEQLQENASFNKKAWQEQVEKNRLLKTEVKALKEENAGLKRALEIESQEPIERSQEANHYNWLDEQNTNLLQELAKVKDENATLKARLEGWDGRACNKEV